MQPTHARWEQINDYEIEAEAKAKLSHGHFDEHMEEQVPTMFSPVKPIYSRNYMIIDTVYESPAYSNLGVPGPDGDSIDLGFNGLSGVSDEVKSLLPQECLGEFEKTLKAELDWKRKWGTESSDTLRNQPAIDKGVV